MITKFLYQFYALFPTCFVANLEWVAHPFCNSRLAARKNHHKIVVY
jgi:hypothetical protein